MRWAVVTGCNGGIGSSVCAHLRENGWSVLGTDREAGGTAQVDDFLHVDFADGDALARIASDLAGDRRPFAALVNNAAEQVCQPLAATDLATWDRLLRVNLSAAHVLTTTLAPTLADNRGAIVNVASVHALHTTPEMAAYAATKAALVGYTRASALDLAPAVRANAVLPGAIDTQMLRAGFARRDGADDPMQALIARTPLGRVGVALDVARLIAFLLDPDLAGFITGQSIVIDGGVTARLASE